MRFLILFSMSLIGCSPSNNSTVRGYHEGQDAKAVESYVGKLKIVPEYAPSSHVVVSRDLKRSDFEEAIKAAGATPLHVSSGSIWARDWGPIIAKDGEKNVIVEFNYSPLRPEDDIAPREISAALGLPRVSVPLFLEGGNLMVNDDGLCLLSSWAIEEQDVFEDWLLKYGNSNPDLAKKAEFVKERPFKGKPQAFAEYMEKFAGCKVEILQRMPEEETGHIDMFAKFVSNDTVLVNKIDNDTLQWVKINVPAQYALAQNVAAFLDTTAQRISQLNVNPKVTSGKKLKVLRLPMPAPVPVSIYSKPLFRSYSNFLLLNGHALVPAYGRNAMSDTKYPSNQVGRGAKSITGAPWIGLNDGTVADMRTVPNDAIYPDQNFGEFEAKVEKILKDLGMKSVTFLPSESSILSGGAVHCTTAQLAK